MRQTYPSLRKYVRQAGYSSVIWGLSAISGKSYSRMKNCLRGARSFQPDEIKAIAEGLNKNSSKEINKLFPALGIEVEDQEVRQWNY